MVQHDFEKKLSGLIKNSKAFKWLLSERRCTCGRRFRPRNIRGEINQREA